MVYKWSYTGKYHRLNEAVNQDCLRYNVSDKNAVITLADGVSSCDEACRGASIAAEALTLLLSLKGTTLIERKKEQIARIATAHMLYEIEKEAANSGKSIMDYSSTVAGAMFDKKNKKLLCFNIGDSIIIGVTENKCIVLSLPRDSTNGCCVTTTKDAELEAMVKIIDTENINSVVLCSDGAWREMFHAGRIRPEVKKMLTVGEYESLKAFLTQKNTYDDCSFIAMDVNSRRPAC